MTAANRAKRILASSGVVAVVVAVAAVLWLVFPGEPAAVLSLRFDGFIDLPKGKGAGLITVLDYLTIDDDELFVANESAGSVYEIALRDGGLTGADVATLDLGPAVHGVAIDPVSGAAFATQSNANTIDVFDPHGMHLLGRIPVADDPDAIFYISSSRLIYVAHGDAKLATVIDPATRKVIETIDFGGKLEFGAYDSQTQLFYQNIQDANVVAAVNLKTKAVVAKWPVGSCIAPTGMAIDSKRRLLFVGCNGNATLVAFSLVTHQVISAVPVGSGPDSVAYDTTLHRIYVTGRSGTLSVIREDDGSALRGIDSIRLHYGAHTLAADPRSHRLYVGYASALIGPRIAVFSPVPNR